MVDRKDLDTQTYDEFNKFAEESATARAEYDRLAQAKVADPLNDEIAEDRKLIEDTYAFIARYNEIVANYSEDSAEYQQVMEEMYYYEFGPDYVIAKAEQRISENQEHLEVGYDYPMLERSWEVEHYNELKAARDEAAQNVANLQNKLDELNAKNAGAETEAPAEEVTEETALSEDVYTVFNNVKAIVMENPELLQKVYALYNNEKAVETAKSAYNYVVANVDIRTINHYAKQLAGMDITPELVNTYLDMFTNWVNK